jgi:hypothetical protein
VSLALVVGEDEEGFDVTDIEGDALVFNRLLGLGLQNRGGNPSVAQAPPSFDAATVLVFVRAQLVAAEFVVEAAFAALLILRFTALQALVATGHTKNLQNNLTKLVDAPIHDRVACALVALITADIAGRRAQLLIVLGVPGLGVAVVGIEGPQVLDALGIPAVEDHVVLLDG